MPTTSKGHKFNPDGTNHGQGSWFAIADSKNRGSQGVKVPSATGRRTAPGNGVRFTSQDCGVEGGTKVSGLNWWKFGELGYKPKGFNVTAAQQYRQAQEGIKSGGDWFNSDQPSISKMTSSKSDSRKAASAMIAKIPLPLSRHIAATYYPKA